MPLERKVPKLFQNGLAILSRELPSSNLLGEDVAELQRQEGRHMESLAQPLSPERGFRMDFRKEPVDRHTGIHHIATHRSRSSRIRSALSPNVRPDFLNCLRNRSIRFQAAS